MDLTPVYLLAHLLAYASLATVACLILPAGGRRAGLWAGGLTVALIGAVAVVVLGFTVSMTLWRDYPDQAHLVSAVLAALAIAVVVRIALPAPERDDTEEDDDGGGSARPSPPEPRGPQPDWADFDSLRDEWESETRVPVRL